MGRDKREQEAHAFRKPRLPESAGNVADWGGADAEILRKLVEIASKKGGAVRLGYTRDGGAYAIGVYAGPNYFTDYVRPNEDIDGYLTALIGSFEDYDGSDAKAPTKKPAGRE